MPWWPLIWSALAVVLVGTLVGLGAIVFKKFMAALDALGELGEQLSALDPGTDPAPDRLAVAAIFQNRHMLGDTLAQQSARRAHRRQARRDHRVARGKLLRPAPPIQRTHPHA